MNTQLKNSILAVIVEKFPLGIDISYSYDNSNPIINLIIKLIHDEFKNKDESYIRMLDDLKLNFSEVHMECIDESLDHMIASAHMKCINESFEHLNYDDYEESDEFKIKYSAYLDVKEIFDLYLTMKFSNSESDIIEDKYILRTGWGNP